MVLPMHTPLASLNAHPSIHLWDSGPIQWVRGGVGLRRRAPPGRQSRMEGKKPAHLLLLYDDCLVTQHP